MPAKAGERKSDILFSKTETGAILPEFAESTTGQWLIGCPGEGEFFLFGFAITH